MATHIASLVLAGSAAAFACACVSPPDSCPGSPDGDRGGAINQPLDQIMRDGLNADGDPVDWKSVAIPERAPYEFTVFVDTPGARPSATVYTKYGEPVGTLAWTGSHELSGIFELHQGFWFCMLALDTGASEYRLRVRRVDVDGVPVPKPPPPELEPIPWSERRG